MNSRPVVLIFLLLVLIITSQIEWKQQIGEAEANPAATRRRQQALTKRKMLLKGKERANPRHADDFSIKRCISVLNTMEDLSNEEKSKAFGIFKDAQNRDFH